MIKYKYLIDAGNFTDMASFNEYLNRMGKKGYWLVQWHLVSTSFAALNSIIQPVSNTLSILITWKIKSSE